ncbi:RecF/RecN/SMC protein [Coniochaeta ligniaria NRRL 30616]|uniref:Structural maintenance of chromosomes protein n=1 Tax=Coniochaeta ligniaria NRRL 30616 TaxID=1408157 RepID=A0A1J7J1V1_9PEZI|nr:RecF/RecN/SMC protein [Coniochaeta ligniaria NRRL 30616]
MFIKQIIIQGFKSYKDQTIIEPFSPGTNVIVGRNGSGKSNFFAAIRFVLSDAYTQMTREERQGLLHEGSGSAVMSAYVEVIFDNADTRFPGHGEEVTIRRTIGLKKDEYSLDKKVVTRQDITSLLESAGFSKANPYYIVPQGRVTALTNMKESDRLNLLKEIAGTKVYEERRTESLKIMNETNNKREKIDELLEYIKDRLSELEEEKEELRGFQDKDRERRCLEYAYHHQQQEAVAEKLAEIEEARLDGTGASNKDRQAFQAGEKAIAKLERTLQELQQQMELLTIERRQLDEDRRDIAKTRAKAELKAKHLDENRHSREQQQSQQEAQLKEVRRQIQAKEAELAKLIPEFEKRKAEEAKVKQQLDAAEAGRTRLFTKQTRSSQFRSKAERDAWLKKEIDELNLSLSKQKALRLDAEEEVRSVQQSIVNLEQEIAQLRAQLDGYGEKRASVAEELNKAQEVLDQLNEERRRLRREDEKLDSVISNCRQERDRAERDLSHAMDSMTSRGLATIRRLKREHDIPGAYGTLAELMDVPEAYRIPVEQVAGTSLFHYVVDTAETATFLVNALQKSAGGRITFMPLDKLRQRHANLPRASDAVPLISKINYDPQYEVAFQQVFGRTIVCPNLTVAAQYARSHGVDGITPEGDTTNKRGAMTGGYIDSKRSRLEAVRNVNKWRDQFEAHVASADGIRRQIEIKDQEITRAMGELQKLEAKMRQVDNGFEPLKAELRNKTNQLERQKDHLASVMERHAVAEKNMKDFADTLAAHEAELASDFKKALSAGEERQLEEFDKQATQLHKKWNEVSAKRRELEGRKRMLELELNQNLHPQEDQLSSAAFENTAAVGGSGSYQDAQKELKKAQKAADEIERQIRAIQARVDGLSKDIADLEKEKAQREQDQQELARQIEKQQRRIEKNVQKKALLTSQAAEAAKNIRELGVLPEEAFGKYERMKPESITARLKKVNEALRKYQHVNKKAFEQYNSFTTQQDQLLKRRKELDTSQKSIEELVAHLDQVKDEQIERTFKQVSREFANIFERLVPAGHGRLVIQRRADRRQDPEDSDEEPRGGVENYTGVGISVSFNSKTLDEQQKIQQLSGGQKSLCALCLIFAIQAAEASPMVIFDEVDANLDAQYRTAVAALLETISREAGTQFICTTFRPEIVRIADKCYGVLFRNKNSTIDCVPTEEALNFVEGQQSGKS